MKLSVRWKREGDLWRLLGQGLTIATVRRMTYEYWSSPASSERYCNNFSDKMYFTPREAKRAVERRLRLT